MSTGYLQEVSSKHYSRFKCYRIIPHNYIRNNFLAPEKPWINKFFVLLLIYLWYRINESTQLLIICDACSDVDKWILQEWIDGGIFQLRWYIIFPKQNIVYWVMVLVIGVILVGIVEYFTLYSTIYGAKNIQVYESWKRTSKITKYIYIGSVFRTQSNVYDRAFLQKQLTVFSC